MKAIAIPKTTPQRYISFQHALNLRLPGEYTGDWHPISAFFDENETRTAPIAGKGGTVDTTPSLGDRGIRDMSSILATQDILPVSGPVYVANHYRAIADIAMLELHDGIIPTIANSKTINQWLDTEEQIQQLVTEYLLPLRTQLNAAHQQVFDKWIATVQFD